MAAGDNIHPDMGPAFVPAPAPAPLLFSTAGGIKAPRSPVSFYSALGAHALAIALIAWMIVHHVKLAPPVPVQVATVLTPITTPPPMPMLPKAGKMGGGGGQHDLAPVTQGHLPKLAQTQIVPPKAPPTIPPKLAD